MPTVLMIPMHLDALVLSDELSVLEPMADFRRLPYFNGQRDVHPDVANISEELLSQPFDDRGLFLQPGVHLHWALPDALTQGISESDPSRESRDGRQPGASGANGATSGRKITFPALPNRWLITRRAQSGAEKKWVVESDFLHLPDQTEHPGAITYPYPHEDPRYPHAPRFRYLGRKVPWQGWKEQDADSKNPDYLSHREPLTAIGYGEPCFAAFYPNSLSVFGFYDDILLDQLPGATYEVIGWYSDPRRDAVNFIIERARGLGAQKDWRDILKDEAEWAVAGSDPAALKVTPERTVCYASVTFADGVGAGDFTDRRTSTEHVLPIVLGNTSIEALSAHLAHALGADKSSLMDQLEAIHVASQLEGGILDLGWRFRQARHASRFTAVRSGIHWTIRPEAAAPVPGNAEDPPIRGDRPFPTSSLARSTISTRSRKPMTNALTKSSPCVSRSSSTGTNTCSGPMCPKARGTIFRAWTPMRRSISSRRTVSSPCTGCWKNIEHRSGSSMPR